MVTNATVVSAVKSSFLWSPVPASGNGDVLKGISPVSFPCQKGTLFGSVPYYRKTKLSRKQLAEAWGSCRGGGKSGFLFCCN